jgi:hypothetical protein
MYGLETIAMIIVLSFFNIKDLHKEVIQVKK